MILTKITTLEFSVLTSVEASPELLPSVDHVALSLHFVPFGEFNSDRDVNKDGAHISQ